LALNSVKTASLDKVKKLFPGHFGPLEQNPLYQDAVHYVYIESQGDWTRSQYAEERILKASQHRSRYIFKSEDSTNQNRTGVLIGADVKTHIKESLMYVMSENRLSYASNFSSMSPMIEKQQLYKQMQQFREDIITNPNNPNIAAKTYITGKSPGQPDDRVIALGGALYHMKRERLTRQFINLMNSKGMPIDY